MAQGEEVKLRGPYSYKFIHPKAHTVNDLIFIDKYPGTDTERAIFEKKVIEVADALKTDPDYLMTIMYIMSGLNPKAVNESTGASGLFQFLPKTAKDLGTTVEKVREMNSLVQMNYALKYMCAWIGRLNTYFEVYAVAVYPQIAADFEKSLLKIPSESLLQIFEKEKWNNF